MDDMNDIYRQHAQTVYKFLLSQTRDPDLAEELTQETFYQAVRSIDRFDGRCKVSVWLCQIARHLWYQHLRRKGFWPRRGSWSCCGRSTACRRPSGKWCISGPSADSPSGRSAT